MSVPVYIAIILTTALAFWLLFQSISFQQLQIYAPQWIPRQILGECMYCTTFWFSVPISVWLVLDGFSYGWTYSFVLAGIMKFLFDNLR